MRFSLALRAGFLLLGGSILPVDLGPEAWSSTSRAHDIGGIQAPLESGGVTTPLLPMAVIAGKFPTPGSSPTDLVRTPISSAWNSVPGFGSESSVDCRSVLVDVQLLEKYMAFRESLSSP